MWTLTLLIVGWTVSSGVLGVQVLGADGRGLPGAGVSLCFAEPGGGELVTDCEWGDTDGDGRVLLPDPAPALWLHLRVDHRLYEAFEQTLPPGRGPPLTVRLPRPPWRWVDVTGRVVTPVGDPVAGAEVTMSRARVHAGWPFVTKTDDAGVFRVRGLVEGGYRTAVEAPGWPPLVEGAAVVEGMAPLELRLTGRTRVYGAMLGASDDIDWRVTAQEPISYGYEPLDDVDVCAGRVNVCICPDGVGQWVSGRTVGGDYEIELPPGEWRLVATNEKFRESEPWRAQVDIRIEEGQREVRIDLDARPLCGQEEPVEIAGLRGVVYDEVTGAPVPEAQVVGACRGAITGPGGVFDLGEGCSVRGRTHTLSVDPPDGWASRRVEGLTPDLRWVEIVLEPSIGFCYQLRWADGQPARSSVEVYEPDGEERLARSDPDASGRGCIPELPAGDYDLLLRGMGWEEPGERRALTIPTETVAITLPMVGAVEILAPELESRFGNGWLRGVGVRLDPVVEGARPPIVREEVESLYLEKVEPGLWQITVTAPDGREWQGLAEVRAREMTVAVVR